MFFFFTRGMPGPQRLLVGLAVGAVIWLMIYGAQGYTVGPAPIGANPLACYRTAKIDFFIPMYKQVPAYDC